MAKHFLAACRVAFCSLSLMSLMSVVGSPSASASDSAWVIKRDSSYVEIQGGYGRFTENNALTQQLSMLAHMEIGFLETATLLLEMPFTTRSLERPGQTPNSLTNNGLTDIFLGTRIRLIDEPFGLALRIATHIPTGYNVSYVPVLGDRVLDFELGLNAGYEFYPVEAYVQGGLGYRYKLNYDKAHVIVTQAAAANPSQTILKPADQIFGFLEAGAWILPELFASLSVTADLGLNQNQAWSQSQVLLRPLVAWRANPYVDLSVQLDQSLWSQRQPFLTQFLVGAHFHFGPLLNRGKGLRGGITEYAERDESL